MTDGSNFDRYGFISAPVSTKNPHRLPIGFVKDTGANGLALAIIDGGKVTHVQSYGIRIAKGDPLQTNTIMYGASLTKTVMAYAAMQLVDAGKLALDATIADYLEKPLPDYGPDPVFPDKYGTYKDLAGDERWRKITPRMVLTHATGFANFGFMEPDQKLRIHFDPGARYAYSGEGFILLQFAIDLLKIKLYFCILSNYFLFFCP